MKSLYSRFSFSLSISVLLLACRISAVAQAPVDVTHLYQPFSGNNIPAGWQFTNSGSNIKWDVEQGVNSVEGQPTGSAMVLVKTNQSTLTGQNIWAFTNGITLQKDVIYTLRFAQQNKGGVVGNATFRLVFNTTQNHTNATTIATGTWNSGTTWKEFNYAFRVSTTGLYHIGFGVTGFVDAANINIDEVRVLELGVKNFYNKQDVDLSVPDLNLLTSWGANTDGSGPQPLNFSNANQIFNIVNHTSGGKAKLGKDWDVTGMGSKVILGNGTTPVEMTLADKKSITSGPIDVANNATLIIDAPVLPTFGTLAPNSTVTLGKYAPTDISANVDFGNLVIDSSKKNKLTKKIKVNGKLDMKAGKLELGDFDVEIGYGGSIINGSPDNYIITNGKGRARHGVRANQEVTIPVGSATTYNPIKIKAAANSVDDIFSVNVINGVYKNYINDVPVLLEPLTLNTVNKTWIINEDVKGGSNITLTLSWALTDALTGFNPNECYVMHYENNVWDSYIAGKAILQTVGLTTLYSISRPNIRSFSPYTTRSGSQITPMPVEFINFTAQPTPAGKVSLNWATAQEQNSDYFEVERSTNGKDFAPVTKVQAKGTTNQRTDYTFTDSKPLSGVSYYRLRQVDLDGTYTYTPTRMVRSGNTQQASISIYPNPAVNTAVNIQLQNIDLDSDAELQLYDLAGNCLLKDRITSDNHTLPASNLKPGVYLAKVSWSKNSLTKKLIIQ